MRESIRDQRDLLSPSERLTTPLLRARKGEPLRPATWDEALAHVSTRFAHLSGELGADALGVLGGGCLTNEAAYSLGKFARVVLGTKHVDSARFYKAAVASASERAFGIDRGLPFPLEDLPGADVIMLVGTNPAETMPAVMRYIDEQRALGGRLVVVDPRRTATAVRASHHLQIAPGTDAALANCLLNVAISDKLIDADYIRHRTAGFEGVKFVAGQYWPSKVEGITGVPADDMVEVAHLLGRAPRVVVLTGRGAEQQSRGVDNVLAFINLTLALGQCGKASSGFGSLTRQSNGQGTREHGLRADQLPGYRRLDNPVHREQVAAAWGIEESALPGPGPAACEILESLADPGGVRALFVMGADLVTTAPDPVAVEKRLRRLEMLVVCDPYLSETAALADVVFPVSPLSETGGTVTNLEGRILHRVAERGAPSAAPSDLQVLKRLATALGRGQHLVDAPRAVFDELARVSAGGIADYSGVSYDRLAEGAGVFWPCPSLAHPGTPRLFEHRFPTCNGRARLLPVRFDGPADEPDEDYPLYLTTGDGNIRQRQLTQHRRVVSLRGSRLEPYVELHPLLAEEHHVYNGDLVRLHTRRGTGLFQARLDESLRPDTLFAPSLAGALVSPALDPVSKLPELKIAAVRLERVTRGAMEEPLDAAL